MKRFLIMLPVMLLFLGMVAGHAAWAEDEYVPFTADELDDLLAPIALYPDPLLAQMLPAATFVDQLDEAARYVWQYGESAQVDDQPWDVSVRAVAHYRDVLFMMDARYDWTVSLGQAFINQEDDVMDSIQRLRVQALAEGNLVSTPEQEVIDEGGIISIVPVQPEVIYVPQYDPTVVYYEPPSYTFVTFSVGLPIGVWLNRDCDWHGHRIRYHGWKGGGWVGRSRPHVHDRDGKYINDKNTAIDVNRKPVRHDTTEFREGIRTDVQKRHERAGTAAQPATVEQPTRTERPARIERPARVEQPTRTERPARFEQPIRVEQPSRVEQPRPARTEMSDVYRGRDVQTKQPASVSGYGGYGSSRDADTYRERGKTSREDMQQFNRPAPAREPAASGGRQSAPSAPVRAPSGFQVPGGGGGGGRGRQR